MNITIGPRNLWHGANVSNVIAAGKNKLDPPSGEPRSSSQPNVKDWSKRQEAKKGTKILFSASLIRRGSVFGMLAFACLLMGPRQRVDAQTIRPLVATQPPTGCLLSPPAKCDANDPTCATFTIWDLSDPMKISGLGPQSIQDDAAGITNQLSPAGPTMITSMDSTCPLAGDRNGLPGDSNGLLYWNPTTNAFKTYCVDNIANGFQFSVDLNRSTKTSSQSDDWYKRFGGGDVWATIYRDDNFSPYMNFRGSGNFTRWNVGAKSATGIRVNPANGKVYFGNFGDVGSEPPEIIELDPATNNVRKWATINRPYQLFFDGRFVWATAVGSATLPVDQILRLDPGEDYGKNNLTRWNLPTNPGFLPSVSVDILRNPNSITMDLEGKVWFTETLANKVGRLDPNANTITEYTKGTIAAPQNISSSGIGETLQAFFTETVLPGSPNDAVSVLTNAVASAPGGSSGPGPVPETPDYSCVQPTPGTATSVSFTPASSSASITPIKCVVTGSDPSGITRFLTPSSGPTGITRVVMPGSVFGSLHDSFEVFQMSSGAIKAPPPSACRQEDGEADEDDWKHDGGKAHASMHHKECEESEKEMSGEDDYKDPSAGIDFRSTQFTSVVHDDIAHSVTVTGLGTNNGLPVAFTIIAVDSTLVPPGRFTIILSNGYTNTGNLSAGSISLSGLQ
jgi:hypothetical protein